MTKKQALIEGIKKALNDFNSYSFKIGAVDLTLTGIFYITIQDDIKYFPSECVDESNLEDLKSGTFNGSFKILIKDNEIEGASQEISCVVFDCGFAVEKYDENKFSIKIQSVNAERR